MFGRRAVLCAVAGMIPFGGYTQHPEARTRPGVGCIRGFALHPDGTPKAGAVEIEPVEVGNPWAVALVSSLDGSFRTESLPAGRYRVGVDLGFNRQPDEAYGRTYYPGTPDRSKAIAIAVAADAPEQSVLFVLPKKP